MIGVMPRDGENTDVAVFFAIPVVLVAVTGVAERHPRVVMPVMGENQRPCLANPVFRTRERVTGVVVGNSFFDRLEAGRVDYPSKAPQQLLGVRNASVDDSFNQNPIPKQARMGHDHGAIETGCDEGRWIVLPPRARRKNTLWRRVAIDEDGGPGLHEVFLV